MIWAPIVLLSAMGGFFVASIIFAMTSKTEMDQRLRVALERMVMIETIQDMKNAERNRKLHEQGLLQVEFPMPQISPRRGWGYDG